MCVAQRAWYTQRVHDCGGGYLYPLPSWYPAADVLTCQTTRYPLPVSNHGNTVRGGVEADVGEHRRNECHYRVAQPRRPPLQASLAWRNRRDHGEVAAVPRRSLPAAAEGPQKSVLLHELRSGQPPGRCAVEVQHEADDVAVFSISAASAARGSRRSRRWEGQNVWQIALGRCCGRGSHAVLCACGEHLWGDDVVGRHRWE